MLRVLFLQSLQYTTLSRSALHLSILPRAGLAALLCCGVVPATFAQASGPVAAYSFDAGSGTSVSDVTGHNNTVSLLNGAAWRTGKYGNAVTFDGVNDFGIAGAAQPSLNLTGRSFTLSAWVNPRSNSGWQMIVNKPYTAGHAPPYFDWSMHLESGTGRLTAFLGCEAAQRPSNSSIGLNTWTHVAVTYDGTALRHYINGVLDRSTAVSCSITNTNSRPIRIGANGGGSEGMNGGIDDVRIYDRPLSTVEVQTDMATALGSVTTPTDGAVPSITLTAPANGATVSGTVNVTASASDDVGVLGVRFRVDGVSLGSEDQSAPFSIAWNTTQLSNGNHTVTATARDAAGNTTTSSVVTVNVSNSGTPPPGSGGPVAAYSFDASSGTTVTDVSGNSNTLNLVNGALWGGGKSGNAVSFDGINDYAAAATANPALNLTGHNFTLSAWVNPRVNNSTWQMIVNKPATVGHSWPYFDWSMHRQNPSGRLVVWLGCDGTQRVSNSSIPLNTWTHVAVTYDGAALRHFINGVLDRSTPVSCSISNTNSRPIRIGANGAGTEVMNGLIDDVRIYNRTLLTAEIAADMGTPLTGGGTTLDGSAPTVAVTAPANGGTVSGTVNLAATASDNVGVIGVQFKVDGVSYGSEDQSAPYAVAWNSTQLGNGNHTLTATARDAAGNSKTSTAITVNVNNTSSTPAPTMSFTANPGSVPSGSSSTLTWSSTNATSCVASGDWSGSKATSGSQSTGGLSTSRTYTLACSGAGGSTNRSVTVSVAAAAPAPSLTLNASPSSVASGGSASLNWSSSDASSCTASGAWSGARATSGTASTGALTNPTNTFTLTCTGPGGSINRSASVSVQGGSTFGLDFPGSAATSSTIRFRFNNPLAIYPATYIWRVHPRQQSGYYTTFFWGNDGPFWWDNGSPNTYYGAHPYPYPPPDGTPHWEIATDRGGDYLSNESAVFDRWYTQALRVWSDGSGKHHEFYWDLPNTSRVIKVDVSSSFGNINPPKPALTFGDAPWNPSNEIMDGVIRGIQIYSTSLSLNDILSEASSPRSTSSGSSKMWYLNLNPTPSDISDKSGAGHNPEWVGTARPQLWSGQ